MSGLRVVNAGTRSGWILMRATLNGQDVTDIPLDLRERDVNGLELELTTRVTTLTGTLVGSDGQPPPDFSVVVFSEDEAKWNAMSRYVTVLRAAKDGMFRTRGLPAANYVAVGIPTSVTGEWQNPDFLKKLRVSAGAVRFSLIDGGSASITVTVKR